VTDPLHRLTRDERSTRGQRVAEPSRRALTATRSIPERHRTGGAQERNPRYRRAVITDQRAPSPPGLTPHSPPSTPRHHHRPPGSAHSRRMESLTAVTGLSAECQRRP